jgi:hypothetical protein
VPENAFIYIVIKLPHCHYPKATDSHAHGLQHLPDELPLLDLSLATPYRSETYRAIPIETFSHEQVVELIHIIARSFVLNEPMNRHLIPPKNPPQEIQELSYLKAYGETSFGAWEKENIFAWIIRLLVFGQLKERLDRNLSDNFSKQLSLAILDDSGKVIGGALSIRIQPGHSGNTTDPENLFSLAVLRVVQPIVNMLVDQEELSIAALCEKYNAFEQALIEGKVGELFMIARSPLLPREDTFELVAASLEKFRDLGYQFVLTAAANQWTGASFEIAGGVRVHFAPYRAKQTVKENHVPLSDETSTRDGFLSAKDSGCMFYVIRLK